VSEHHVDGLGNELQFRQFVDLATRNTWLLLKRERFQGPLFRQVRPLDARLQPPFLLIEPLGPEQACQEISIGRRGFARGGEFTLYHLGHLAQAKVLQQLLNLLRPSFVSVVRAGLDLEVFAGEFVGYGFELPTVV
jgi:hypothetical protein